MGLMHNKEYNCDGASMLLMTFLCHSKREGRLFRCNVCYHWCICRCLNRLHSPGENDLQDYRSTRRLQ